MYKTLGFDVTFSEEQKEILESIYKEIKNDSEIEDAEKNINEEMTKMLEGKEENHLLETLQEYTEIIYTNFVSYIDKKIIVPIGAMAKINTKDEEKIKLIDENL